MDASPLLALIATALAETRLEAVLIGNAAAALHGAPVTTIDFDFLFRKSVANLKKLKAFAAGIDGIVLKPYYPASDLYRVVNEDRGLQVDFMSTIHGIRSLAALRSRAARIEFSGAAIWVASLEDIIASKKAAGRARDAGVLPILEKTLRETKKFQNRQRSGSQERK